MTAQDMPTSLMVYAAGFGTRMGTLTRDCPKPLIPVAGKALVDHTLDLTHEISPDVIVANAHYKAEMLIKHLTPRGVQISHETPDILDSGGGLLKALPLLGATIGAVYTSNSDAIWAGPNPFTMLRAAWDPARMDGLMLCIPLARAVGRKGAGDFSADGNGHITWGGDLVWGGIQILKTAKIAQAIPGAFPIRPYWTEMIETKRLFALEYPGHWCDVGHPDGISMAEDLLSNTPE